MCPGVYFSGELKLPGARVGTAPAHFTSTQLLSLIWLFENCKKKTLVSKGIKHLLCKKKRCKRIQELVCECWQLLKSFLYQIFNSCCHDNQGGARGWQPTHKDLIWNHNVGKVFTFGRKNCAVAFLLPQGRNDMHDDFITCEAKQHK